VSRTKITVSRQTSVWFYIGLLLLIYGVIILGAGIYQLQHRPSTVLARYNATFWGGLILSFLGSLYVSAFWP
jgi:hypothetical protein